MTSGVWRIGVFLFLFACNQAGSTVPHLGATKLKVDYTVTVVDGLRGARVRVCLDGGPVYALAPIGASATTRLHGAWRDDQALEIEDERILLGESGRAGCVDYATRFSSSWIPSDGSNVIAPQSQWLWRPSPFPDDVDVAVRFVLPPGARVSLPWPHVDGAYRPDDGAFFADAYAVFGTFETEQLSSGKTHAEVVLLGPRPSTGAVRRWLDRAIRAASSLGSFPRSDVHFVVAPVDVPRRDVVFGMLRRGGGASILLVPSVDASREALDQDWVAVHELSHLWLPPFEPSDRWLSEGIATYLQEILRARCGLQPAARAWVRLDEGFARGRRSGTGRTLALEARDMDRTGAYHRVYWAGAAFALEADLQLRERSAGNDTLLTALRGAESDWRRDVRPISRSTFFRALDPSGSLEALGKTYVAKSAFPDTDRLLSTERRSLREEITKRDDEACGISAESSP